MASITFRNRALLASLAAAGAVLVTAGPAAAQPFGHFGGSVGHFGGGGAHVGMPSGGFHGAPGFHGASPHVGAAPGFHGASPQVGAAPGFHGSSPQVAAAPGFRGASPRVGVPVGASHPEFGGHGRDPGHFSGRSVNEFSSADRARWSGGGWRHGWRHGRYGWWWAVGDDWFFYDQPSYPYPADVSDDVYSDDSSAAGAYCEDPPGYYPDVTECNVEWEPPSAQ